MVYGIPGWASVQVLYYRTDMFEEAGLSAPETWDDFRDAAIKLTDEKNGIYVQVLDMVQVTQMQSGSPVQALVQWKCRC